MWRALGVLIFSVLSLLEASQERRSATVIDIVENFLEPKSIHIQSTYSASQGPFGFLVFDDGEDKIEGNQGLRDQQLAMMWVKENIEKFGGDSDRVTIFGESAGAQSVMFHMTSQISEPLYQRAIMESNPAVYWYPNRQQALFYTDQLVKTLRCSVVNIRDCCDQTQSNYSCLMQSSSEALISGMLKIMGLNWAKPDVLTALEPFRPFIDDVEFSDQPMMLFKEGKWNTEKPLIIGFNEEELVVLKYILPMNESIFREANRYLFDGKGHHANTGDIISDKYIYNYGPGISDFGHIFGLEMTDIFFGCTSRALARFASKTTQSDVYLYVFSHALDGEDCQDRLGKFCGHSYHGSELYFVFRNIEHLGMLPDDEDHVVSNQFSYYWGNMAWTGNPSEGPDFGLEGNYPDWLRYENAPEGSWTNLRVANPTAYLETNYLTDLCDFWDTLGLYEAPSPDNLTDRSTTTSMITESHMETTTSGSSKVTSCKVLILRSFIPISSNFMLSVGATIVFSRKL